MIKFASYNCNSVRNNSENVKKLLEKCDVLFLQELMLSKSDLPLLNDFNKRFRNIAYVRDREAEGINEGRPSKGVAIFWRDNFSTNLSPILINDSCIGLVLTYGSNKILMLNVYMPCDKQTFAALDEYRSMLANLEGIIQEQNINEVILVGDFNADPNKGRFWNELVAFKETLSLVFVDEQLPNDSFTYLCPARNTTSWLDHIFCTANLVSLIRNVNIDYDSAIFDHFSIHFELEVEVSCNVLKDDIRDLPSKMVKWNSLSEHDKKNVREIMDGAIISEGLLNHEVFLCREINCTNTEHQGAIEMLFEKAKDILFLSTEKFSYEKSDRFRVIPGWNDNIKELYADARYNFHCWRNRGKPVCGQYLDLKISRS